MTYTFCRIATRFALGLVFLCGLSLGSASAQIAGKDQLGLNLSAPDALTQLRKRMAQSSLSTSALPLEGAVDPTKYIVGPGDLFSVSISLLESAARPIPVSADGKLLLPDGKPIQIAGMSLDQAREKILTQLSISFVNAHLDVVLAGTRQFYVHVSGAISRPGRYLALPIERVSGILEQALSDTTRAPVSNPDFRPSLRNITIVHRDGTEASADLLGYFSSGDVDRNPYLRDGDVIFVPAYNPGTSSIYVGGLVPFPGAYDFRSDDTLEGVLNLAGGISDLSAVDDISVIRASDDGDFETFHFEPSNATGGADGSFALKARDHIAVSRLENRLGSVAVSGRVSRPGMYPVVAGKTTLDQLLKLAGGLKGDALLKGVYLERRALPVADENGDSMEASITGLMNRQALADTTAILQKMRLSGMDFLSRSYFARELKLQNRVSLSVDGDTFLTGSTLTLEDGDRLVVPRDEGTVYVFGQVQRPGFLTVLPHAGAEEYVAAAGGRGSAADGVYIIRAGDNRFIQAGSEVIETGDMVFVDRQADITDDAVAQRLLLDVERLDLEIRRQQSDSRFRILQTILQTAATTASVVALIITARR